MLDKFTCPCGAALQEHSTIARIRCRTCGTALYNYGDGRWAPLRRDNLTKDPPAGPCGSVPAGDVAVAEVRKLAERVTVLEGMVGELRRTIGELLRAPAPAPAEQQKGYWR